MFRLHLTVYELINREFNMACYVTHASRELTFSIKRTYRFSNENSLFLPISHTVWKLLTFYRCLLADRKIRPQGSLYFVHIVRRYFFSSCFSKNWHSSIKYRCFLSLKEFVRIKTLKGTRVLRDVLFHVLIVKFVRVAREGRAVPKNWKNKKSTACFK